jgi:hypothetical protein
MTIDVGEHNRTYAARVRKDMTDTVMVALLGRAQMMDRQARSRKWIGEALAPRRAEFRAEAARCRDLAAQLRDGHVGIVPSLDRTRLWGQP